MKILITGMAGSIGSELTRQLAENNKLFGIDINETGIFDIVEELQLKGHWIHGRVGDIREQETLEDVFSDFKPEVVIHAGALKHVKPNEDYPIETIKTNVIGTYNVLAAAKKWQVKKLIYISTDKVVNANSVMGQTKKLGETLTLNMGYTAVRFGNVFGSRGSVVPIWRRQVENKEPITITDERMERYFMSIPDACKLVIKAMEIAEPGKIMVMDMGERKNILAMKNGLFGKDYPVRFIGIRPGETLIEKLMTEEEEKKAIKQEEFYII